MKQTIRIHLWLVTMALALVALVMFLIPHADRQSFSYELNQPWRYPLLTAQFDIPVMRDSTSLSSVRDSIDKHFVTFVRRDRTAEKQSIAAFRSRAASMLNAHDVELIAQMLQQTYETGVVSSDLYSKVQNYTGGKLRMSEKEEDADAVAAIDASAMASPAKAYAMIDSMYHARFKGLTQAAIPADALKLLSEVIEPNIVVDSVTDSKYRSQEYLNVTGAQGIIKKGQRIVDRGEIVTPQIYTNLNTYQEMLAKTDTDNSRTYYLAGQILYMLICVSLLYSFMFINRPLFIRDVRKMTFLMSFIALFVVVTIVLFQNVNNGVYLVPFGALPVVILIFFDSRTVIFSLLTAVLISALVAANPYRFIFIEMCVGLVATFSIHQLSRRSQLVRTALLSFATYVVSYIAICLVLEGNFKAVTWSMVGIFAINSIILSFAYILMVVIEKVFGFTSTVTLVELSDINSPLLRRLAEEAPGTFQHSMQVSTLASEAALAIGANVQLVRTGALYHDIGKLESPVFFTENQHGVNPHAGLEPEVSAKKIIGHVAYGLQLAQKHKLPEVIRRFISEHHGSSVTRYFYNTAVNNRPGEEVDKAPYTYPGPDPQSKETAILMMADAVEAASRSLKDYSADSISSLVDRIVDGQQAEGRFNDSPLSFRELGIVKSTFKKRLSTIYHTRVEYPEIKSPQVQTPA